jgi:hypothetical protein
MSPLFVPWGYPYPLGLPVPTPAINMLGLKVNENDESAFINIGSNVITQIYSQAKDVAVNQQTGEFCWAPVWWANVVDPDGNDSNAWVPQGYL